MIGLSKSSLEGFKSCPRCFWLEKNAKLKKPEGIKASIMDGIDDAMKRVAEHAVLNCAPAHYLREVQGAKPFRNRALLNTFMSWRTFQARIKAGKHEALIWGQLDDLIEWQDGRVSPWDFKSNGKERDWEDYTERYNTLQADMYEILLKAQGLTTTGEAYFTYSWPVVSAKGVMEFDFKTVKTKPDANRAIKVISEALDCLGGPEPESNPECEYCSFVNKRAYRLKQKTLA
jgi:hypothetical protein